MPIKYITDAGSWKSFLSKFPEALRDIHFGFEYLDLFSGIDGARPGAVTFKGRRGMHLIYPFMLKPIMIDNSGDSSDIESAYGYGGPAAMHYNPEDASDFEIAFHEWCLNNKIIAEFIRFHPLVQNHDLFSRDIELELNRYTVTVNLEPGWDKTFAGAEAAKRRNWRKASKAGLEACFTEDFEGFADLYYSTMKRLNAEQRYFFPRSHFRKLAALGKDYCRLLEVKRNAQRLAAGIFLISCGRIYYYLGASQADALQYAPNDFMIFSAIKWACENSLKKMLLGGGLSLDPSDGLMRFKSGFSSERAEFYIGKRIHNKNHYERLMNLWQNKHSQIPRLFLQYHE